MPSLEDAKLQEVGAPERERRPDQDVRDPGPPAPVAEVLCRPRRIEVDLLEMMAQVPVRSVFEGLHQPPRIGHGFESFMNPALDKTPVFPEETNGPIVAPAAAPHQAA